MDSYFWAKALHLVSIVSWFAGLFYIGRLFIYHAEAQTKPEPERGILTTQFALMERRLWRAITTPAMIGTVAFGLWLLYAAPWPILNQPWFHAKLSLLVLLFGYHGYCGRVRRNLAKADTNTSQKVPTVKFLRFWNEAATVLLFCIVFTAVFKRASGAGYGLFAVAILTVVGMTVFLGTRRKSSPHPRKP
jgi:protoporphyrinogen IX oxidase